MPNIIRIMWWIGHAACIGQKKHAHKIVIGTQEGNKPPDDVCIDTSRCKDIKIDLKPFGTQYYTLFTRMQDTVFTLKFGVYICEVILNSHMKCQTGSL